MTKRFVLLVLTTVLFGSSVLSTAALGAGRVVGAPVRSSPGSEQDLDWRRCSPDKPAEFECATLDVPLDYQRPGGRTIEIALSRVKATDPAKRRGVLLMNPGGPGSRGLDLPVTNGPRLPDEVTERYDLIGFDPRGLGASTPISCGLAPSELWTLEFYDEQKFDEQVARARSVARKCWDEQPDLLPFITTRNTARDMDRIRAALGEQRISYLGMSYGTYLGAVFTQLFPARADRIVLDSNVDPDRTWRDMMRIWSIPAERAFDVFAEWAARRHDTYRLGSTSARVHSTAHNLLAELDRQPVRLGERVYDGNRVRRAAGGIELFDGSRKYFATLLNRLSQAEDGSRGLRAPRQPQVPERPSRWSRAPVDNGSAVFLAILCGDASWPRDVRQYEREALRDRKRFPMMGSKTSNITPCAFWPEPREPRTEIRRNQAQSILLVQNSHDMQTPIEGAKHLRWLLRGNSRMAVVKGSWRHGAYPGDCADGTVTDYLAHGRFPERDTTCRTQNS